MVFNEEAAEWDKRVAELLDDQDLRDLLIQRLQDGGNMAKNPACMPKYVMAACTWHSQFPFSFPVPFWGLITSSMAATTLSQIAGSASMLDQDVQREEEDSLDDNEASLN